MEVPRVEGLKPGKPIGAGGCGRVFQATDEAGNGCTVKVFDPSAIFWPLLEKMTIRLESGGWPAGVMRVLSADFESGHPLWITPLVATHSDGGEVRPRNLQMLLDQYPGEQSWHVVKSLARAMARMHTRRVPHGNLKPGNIFIDDDGEVLVADWAMGNIPGCLEFHFTDAVLYQPPEQLRNPAGYLDELGYRWDVFAFGVVAYRLLTGKFPRCHDTFQLVAPPPGESRREGLQADLTKIARNLESQLHITWPDAPANALEAGYREWIERCLALDPAERPASMAAVVSRFEVVELKVAAAQEREALLDQRRRADRRAWRTLFFTGIAGAAAAVMAGLWQLSNSQFIKEQHEHAAEVSSLKGSTNTAVANAAAAQAGQTEAQQSLAYERDLALARLEASRLTGDRLFAWAMEKGNRLLPPLDGRELRLKRLERYFEDFLTRTSEIKELADERARIRLQLAEISIAAGDAGAASKRLGEALQAWSNLPMDAELKLRLATDALLLALHRQSTADPEAGEAFVAARKALTEVPRADVDADRLDQLLAVLDFHEAKLLASKGDDTKALEQLMRATKSLNHIADLRPDAAILRSELAACYLSSATILEGMGNLGDAREVRSLASVELVKLLKTQPDSFQLRLDLAGCYSAMAESAVLSADIAAAESISKEAMKLLDVLVVEQPDNAEAVSRKASQLGLRAGIQRDRGQAADALKNYDDGIRMLEAIRASAPGNAMASFRLAMLWWQKGRMLGMAGQRNDEIAFIGKARDLLIQLEANASATGPRPEQLQSCGAYLLGDLGHSMQLAGRKDEAVKAFKEAAVMWESLLSSRPQSEEYSESLAWCKQRLADLQ